MSDTKLACLGLRPDHSEAPHRRRAPDTNRLLSNGQIAWGFGTFAVTLVLVNVLRAGSAQIVVLALAGLAVLYLATFMSPSTWLALVVGSQMFSGHSDHLGLPIGP